MITSGNVIMNLIGYDCQIALNLLPRIGSLFVVSIQLSNPFKRKVGYSLSLSSQKGYHRKHLFKSLCNLRQTPLQIGYPFLSYADDLGSVFT